MKNKGYFLRELTPLPYSCALGACPAIFELTPEPYYCAGVACSSIFGEEGTEDYLIIGNKVDPKEVGLEKKVGDGEVLIRIKKAIIDDKKPSP